MFELALNWPTPRKKWEGVVSKPADLLCLMSTKIIFFVWFKLRKFQQFVALNWNRVPPFQKKKMCIGAFQSCKIPCRLRILIYRQKYLFLSFSGWLSKKYFCVKLQRRNRYFPRKFRFIAGILNLEFPFVADSRNICNNGSLMNICVQELFQCFCLARNVELSLRIHSSKCRNLVVDNLSADHRTRP